MIEQLHTIRKSANDLAGDWNNQYWAREKAREILTALTQIEADHYSAADMASAAAQGFRDGAASVAQQPQEPDWKHPKIQALIGADARNRIVIDLIWRILENPQGEFSASYMEYWDSIHDAVQAAVMKARQPQAKDEPSNCTQCSNADSWGTPDKPVCLSCKAGSEWEPLNKSSVNPNKQPQARPDFNDEWTGYLKDGETPFERFLRERKDMQSVLKLYKRVLEENERLKGQQPQADTPQATTIAEAARDVGKWLNERPNRPIDLRHVAMLVAHAMQPQAEPDIHEAQGQIEFLDKKNNALSAAIRKVMARLADLLDEDQFKEIEEIVSFAGVQPQAEAVPLTHVLVPVDEPTDEMVDAACAAVDGLCRVDFVRAYVAAFAHLKAGYRDESYWCGWNAAIKFQQAEAVPVVDRVYEAAKRLVDHADFQLGGVLSAKSKARDIPSNAASKVKARHLASLRDALAKAPQQAEVVPSDVVRDAAPIPDHELVTMYDERPTSDLEMIEFAREVERRHGIGVQPKHITDGSPCWCNPDVAYADPETGASVIVHRRPQ